MKKSGVSDGPKVVPHANQSGRATRRPGEIFDPKDLPKRQSADPSAMVRRPPSFDEPSPDLAPLPMPPGAAELGEPAAVVASDIAAAVASTLCRPRSDGAVPVHVSKCAVWEGNPRHSIDMVRLEELANSLRENGQETAVDVIRNPASESAFPFLIIGGQRRWLATTTYNINDGILFIRIRDDLVTDEQIYAAAIEPQVHTEPLQAIDYAISLAKVGDGAGGRALARALGKDPAEISKLQQVGKMPDGVLAVLKRKATKFTYPFAYEVVQVCKAVGESMAAIFANEIADRDYTFKKTVARREQLVGDKGKVTRSTWSHQHKTNFGPVKMREDSRDIQMDLKSLPEDKFREIRIAIERVLDSAGDGTE